MLYVVEDRSSSLRLCLAWPSPLEALQQTQAEGMLHHGPVSLTSIRQTYSLDETFVGFSFFPQADISCSCSSTFSHLFFFYCTFLLCYALNCRPFLFPLSSSVIQRSAYDLEVFVSINILRSKKVTDK